MGAGALRLSEYLDPMASALTDKLSRLVKEMRGQARITESNVQDMLREVRMALLEADVALPVVRDFIARVKETDRRLREDFGGARKTVALFTHALFMKAFFQVQEQPNTPVQKLMNEFFDCPVIHNCDIFTIEV